MYNVIASGSKGNAVIYHKNILVDCGVPFTSIKPSIFDLSIVLLTHEHLDHINIKTLKTLQFERPSLRIGCGSFMAEKLNGLKNIDIYEAGQIYDYGTFQISPVTLYHDVKNFGYRIFKNNTKIFHATDTAHLVGISAKEYDLYAIESNYNEETIHEEIAEIENRGGFAYQKGVLNSHLSEQQARDFIFNNKKEASQVLRLHEHKN